MSKPKYSSWPDESLMPEPYRSIKNLPFDEHGWFRNGELIEYCLKIKPAKIVIEVGSWLGLSTRFMARIIPDDGIVYAIDTWLGSKEHLQDSRLFSKIPHLYQTFLSNVKHAELTKKIVPIRMASLEASEALNVEGDLIYIDASHEEEDVYNDIIAWHPHLAEGGIICGDDWHSEPVRNGVMQAAITLNSGIKYLDRFWMLE